MRKRRRLARRAPTCTMARRVTRAFGPERAIVVSMLQACPFCRTLYRVEEGKMCPDCGLELVPMQGLSLSEEALAEEPVVAVLPEDELLGWNFWGRGRGALLALSALGLV